jgi:DNA polymerase III epsilon subunit-like protein
MSNMCYFILDVETTGFKPGFHEIVEFSLIKCSDRTQLSHYVRAEFPARANPKSLEIIQRSRTDILKGISKEEAFEQINKFICSDGASPEARCVIGHQVYFDRNFVWALFRQMNKNFPANFWLDTKSLTKNWLKKQGILKPDSLTLEACLAQNNIKPMPGKHNAIADAQNTYLLWHKAVEAGNDLLELYDRKPSNIYEENSIEE